MQKAILCIALLSSWLRRVLAWALCPPCEPMLRDGIAAGGGTTASCSAVFYLQVWYSTARPCALVPFT